jgi:hypothetical protein
MGKRMMYKYPYKEKVEQVNAYLSGKGLKSRINSLDEMDTHIHYRISQLYFNKDGGRRDVVDMYQMIIFLFDVLEDKIDWDHFDQNDHENQHDKDYEAFLTRMHFLTSSRHYRRLLAGFLNYRNGLCTFDHLNEAIHRLATHPPREIKEFYI